MMKYFVLLIAIILNGCAMQPSQSNVDRLSNQARVRDTAPTCSNPTECQNKWDAAQIWVTKNADYKIQVSSSAIIETYNSPNGSVDLAMRVTKEPIGDGKYQFSITIGCGNWIFGCKKDTVQAALEFNNYINSIK